MEVKRFLHDGSLNFNKKMLEVSKKYVTYWENSLIVYSPISGQYSYFIFFLWFSDVFSVHEKEVSEAATRGALLKSCF